MSEAPPERELPGAAVPSPGRDGLPAEAPVEPASPSYAAPPRRRSPLSIFLGYSFRASVAYCGVGIAVELGRRLLPAGVYEELGRILYSLPLGVLRELGLATPLAEAAYRGQIPPWLASSVPPAIGVAAIFGIGLLSWLAWRLLYFAASPRSR